MKSNVDNPKRNEMPIKRQSLFLLLALLAFGCGDDAPTTQQLTSELGYDEETKEIVIILNRDLASSEDLRVRLRSLAEGETLDCKSDAAQLEAYASKKATGTYGGPKASMEMFEVKTSAQDLINPTAATELARRAQSFFVDICIVEGAKVAHQARYDIRQALDRKGKGGKFDDLDDGVKIVSNQAYAEACIERMGDIPFWEKVGAEDEMDWNTVNCVEIGTPIPSTADGVPLPRLASGFAKKCDHPQYIYSHCEPDATQPGVNGPRVTSARNDDGTHWVLLCRKSHPTEGRYEDMAMIGHNPFTGDTCFFQNQLPYGLDEKPSNNGTKIPHPADNVSSEKSPEVWNDLWGGIEGGSGPEGGIQCMGCHSTDPFIHTPWIDKALRADGTPVVPKMGFHPDFVEGYAGPYHLLDADDQGWNEPKILVSEEAESCTSCHRIALDQWTAPSTLQADTNPDGGCVFCAQAPWVDRLERADAEWDALITASHLDFKYTYWMPPNNPEVSNIDLWADSEMKASMDFIRECGKNPSDPKCKWDSLPREPGDPTELPDVAETGEELAIKSLKILGAPFQKDMEETPATRRCGECHAMSKFGLGEWRERTMRAVRNGIDPLTDPTTLTQEEALKRVNYMRKFNDNPNSVFAADKLGIFSPGVQFPYFQELFQTAFGANWGLQYGAFLQRVSMPKGSHPPLTADEFASIVKWFVEEDQNFMNELIVEVPPPATCEEVRTKYGIAATGSPWLATHLDDMEFNGWGALNEEAGINMYGCSDSEPRNCLADKEKLSFATSAGDVVLLKDLGFDTSYWMRSSADGRYVGNGGQGANTTGLGATITDLVSGKDVGVRGQYDPGFFPNNKAFIMQGSGAGLCPQSILTDDSATADGIDFSEPGCTTAQGINLYQHVAVNTDGGDYFIINGEFTSDSGTDNNDPSAPFYEGSTMKFSPLVFNGTDWDQKDAVIVDSPYEGDSVLSPSGKMVVSRFAGPDGVSLGHMIRRVIATPSGSSYSIDISQPAQFICQPGAKSNISFDERYSVTHHYEDGVANIYLSDIKTGETVKVTDMPAGSKALFPHFISNGWFYFLVTTPDGDKAVASNAALVLSNK